VPPTESADIAARKDRGVWYTPPELVDLVTSRTIDAAWVIKRTNGGRRPLRVLDPACGDGRFLEAAAAAAAACGARVALTGVDLEAGPLNLATSRLTAMPGVTEVALLTADALDHRWESQTFDLVIGNPPFLSQMASRTTRGGSSRHGGGPYADAATEFMSLAIDLVGPGGRVSLILPQSILASRDAAPVRQRVDGAARHLWSWWSPRRHFDAEVLVCALGLERRADASLDTPRANWSHVVADALGVPSLPELRCAGTLGQRAHLNANFRDEYYALVPVVSDTADGPPLVTSGLIDPAVCHWGQRPVRFAKRSFQAPRVDLALLDPKMTAWARRKLVPKVLVASQTAVIEAVADREGCWLPGVPVTSVVPLGATTVDEIAAVLTSPVASVTAWWQSAGTGLSATALRTGPAHLAAQPWPQGDLGAAVAALAIGDVLGCGRAVTRAFGISADHPMVDWWQQRIRSAPGAGSVPRPGL
jgi:SAM-dependent methyltransferase